MCIKVLNYGNYGNEIIHLLLPCHSRFFFHSSKNTKTRFLHVLISFRTGNPLRPSSSWLTPGSRLTSNVIEKHVILPSGGHPTNTSVKFKKVKEKERYVSFCHLISSHFYFQSMGVRSIILSIILKTFKAFVNRL